MADFPVRISFKNMDHSDALENAVQEKIDTMAKHFDRISECAVVIEAPHKHGHKSRIYQVRITMGVPGTKIAVNKGHANKDQSHEDPYIAVRDAFNAATRQLEDFSRKIRGDVKAHVAS
ncbi:MAG: ribosome-associated translation inhibitor RaiA [Rhodospirillaceae bacterium]|jgi:ribosomal subunit interface protein|nr:ribosome-associated translation inhibitor RaiA [Rhodospirillaceae bacterium]MBT6136820.1 ribosome-associated translation inhibitor RaiA [Rhodospirillaceae bacterium]